MEVILIQQVDMCMSKDRFAAKRLRGIADDLSPKKRDIIREHSAFASLLDVSPFNVPNQLIDFLAINISPKLREFNYRGKRILFTKDMVSKVFNLRSGKELVQLLTKSVQSKMRDEYKGNLIRLPITNVATLLKNEDTDNEDAVIRHWDLLCCNTVINPGSGNMMCLDYLDSMGIPKKCHEFDWHEHILELAMVNVRKIQKMKEKPLEPGKDNNEFWISGPLPMLAIIYMDHLVIPRNVHCINYSFPRICFVTSNDFDLVVDIDLDNTISNNKRIFGRRPFLEFPQTIYGSAAESSNPNAVETEATPSASLKEWFVFPTMEDLQVPPRFKNVYETHRIRFGVDVDDTMKQLGSGLKAMQSKRMAALLIDVDAAIRVGDGPSVVLSTDTAKGVHGNRQKDLASQEEDAPRQSGVPTDGIAEGKGAAVRGAAPKITKKPDVYKKRAKVTVSKKQTKDSRISDVTAGVPEAVVQPAPPVAAKEIPQDVLTEKEPKSKAVAADEGGTNVVAGVGAAAKHDGQQKRASDTAGTQKWAEQRKKLRLPEVDPAAVDVEKRERVGVAKIKEVAQQIAVTAPSMVENKKDSLEQSEEILGGDLKEAEQQGKMSTEEDVPQPAVVIDSTAPDVDGGDRDAVNSPVRSETVLPAPTKSSGGDYPIPGPGEWEDGPSFVLWSQNPFDAPAPNQPPSAPAQNSDAPEQAADPFVSENIDGSEANASQQDAANVTAPTGHNYVLISSQEDEPAILPTIAAKVSVEAQTEESIAATPVQPNKNDDIPTTEKEASAGAQTIEKKTRFKRAAKDDASPGKKKRLKVNQEVTEIYENFVLTTMKFKPERSKKKNAIPTPFIEAGHTHCTYKSFYNSMRPRQCLDSQVMGVWTEIANKESKEASNKSAKVLKKYAFSCYLTMKLTVDPQEFDPQVCMREFKVVNDEFKIMKNDILHFPVVKSNHWIICSVNLLHKQLHIFDSVTNSKNQSTLQDAANNLFTNFATLLAAANSPNIDLKLFTRVTPPHPKQKTLYDCGFFAMLYMARFNGKVMADFSSDGIPTFRMIAAAKMINSRENKSDIVKIMREDLLDE